MDIAQLDVGDAQCTRWDGKEAARLPALARPAKVRAHKGVVEIPWEDGGHDDGTR